MEKRSKNLFLYFLPFWIFLISYKFASGLHYALMPPFGEHFLPVWVVGLIVGGTSFIQLMMDVPAGYIVDRLGYLRMLKVTTVIFFSAALCITLGLTRETYLASNFLSIFGYLFFSPGVNAYILSKAGTSVEGRLFSLRDTFGSVGIVLCSVALPFLLLLSPQVVGGVLCAVFFCAFVALFFAPTEDERTPVVRLGRHRLRWLFRSIQKLNPASGMLILLTLSSATFYGVIWFIVPLVIASQQANATLMGLGLGVFDLSVVVLGYLLGRLADRANRRAMVFFGLLVFSTMGMLTGVEFGWLFIFFGFLANVGEEMAGISLWSWLHSLDTEHAADGTISGVVSLFEDIGWAVGPVVGGILYTVVGPSLAISLGALPILLVWVVYYLFVHPKISYENFGTLLPYHRSRTRKHKQ